MLDNDYIERLNVPRNRLVAVRDYESCLSVDIVSSCLDVV